MTDALAHRGPDGEGLWINTAGSTLLGHRRLSVIDLSEAGKQPMEFCSKQSNAARYQIVHNGEIYNYLELREELTKQGYTFRSGTDTEVIIAAYDYWENECVDYFDGMFAFAIWDDEKQILFAARDRFGEKPFFYFFDGKKLLFASEMKALWAAGIPRVANQKMLFNFITIGYTGNPLQPSETFYNDILKLPPASTLEYNGTTQELVLEKYWEIDPEYINKKITDEEATEQFITLLSDAVKKRLRSDVSIGFSLSGGLDSSSLVALVDQLTNNTNRPASSFTAIFPGFEKDESMPAAAVAGKFKLKQYTTQVSADELLNDWEQLCYHQEEPFGSASIYAQYKVYELAKQQGVKVLLDGQGADETLAGYAKYYKWFWQEMFRSHRLFGSKELAAARALGVKDDFGFKNMIAAYFPGFATVALENQYLLKAIRHEDLTKDFVKLQSKEAYYTTPDHYTLNGALHFNTTINGLEELLRYADRNAMAHGREVRLPFLSHGLVEFIFSLPATFKIRNGWTKWILRQTMDAQLPADITWRKDKTGFEPPQQQWMQQTNMQKLVQQARQKLVTENILKKEVLDKPVRALPAHGADNYDWRYLSSAMLFD